MRPKISVIIPTRERARYLDFSLRTCIASEFPGLEVLVLDNASRDDTQAVVAQFTDPRIRYLRGDRRLSMRDNFERGIQEARGDIMGIIGDDDGIFPFTPERVVSLFQEHGVEAVSAARAHYAWPDMLLARRGCGLLPRHGGVPTVKVSGSKAPLRHLLRDNDYYRLPCIYHGFVARSAIERFVHRHGRFFLSGIADAASTFALGLDDIRFAYTDEPLVINGGSVRSNGASQFGGGSEQEQENWKVEDDLGFLPGYTDTRTVGALLVETALRYQRADGTLSLGDILDLDEVRSALLREYEQRRAAGRSLVEAEAMFSEAGLPPPARDERAAAEGSLARASKMFSSFARLRPVDLSRRGVTDVLGAMQTMVEMLRAGKTGMLNDPLEQISVALRMARH